MLTYTVLADANEAQFQNPQELVSIRGGVREDIERLGAELRESHALVGGYDFLLTFEVEDEEAALQVAIAIEGHGLDTETMRAIPIERMGELVEDL
ncbi:GYD domain-containing protein [Halobaculum rubrum]|uniref:GYD domain-containing protein n=1 Tax=Halobaculum rubrum TaxID=2872158 RepID=UPI001CA3E4B2|nr:GYD domain-containing protein [Halobaculum rubrum]QZX99643.1 GYD domain-containing protein [Halobaculum rubrum]